MAQKPRSKSQGSKPKTSKRQQAMDPSISLAWVWREFKGEFPQSDDEKECLAQLELNFKKIPKISVTPNETLQKSQVAQNLARISKSKHVDKSRYFAPTKEKNKVTIALIGFAVLILFSVIYFFFSAYGPPQKILQINPTQVQSRNELTQNSSLSPIKEVKTKDDLPRSLIEEKTSQSAAKLKLEQPLTFQSPKLKIGAADLSQNSSQEVLRPKALEAASPSSNALSLNSSQDRFIEYLLTAQSLLKTVIKQNANAEAAEALDKIDQLRFSFLQEALHLLEQSQTQLQEVKDAIHQLKIANIPSNITQNVLEDLSHRKNAGIMINEQNSIALLSILPLAALALLLIIYLLRGNKSAATTTLKEQPIESAMKNSFLQALNNPEFSHDQIVDLVHSLRSIQNSTSEDGEKSAALLLEEKLSPQDAGRFYIFRHQIIRAGLLLSCLLLGLLFPIFAISLIIIVSLLIFRRLYPEVSAAYLNKLAYADYINKFCDLAEKLFFY